MNPTTHSSRRAFTLLEVLLVMVIIGILAATAFIGFRYFTARADEGTSAGVTSDIANHLSASRILAGHEDGSIWEGQSLGEIGVEESSSVRVVTTENAGTGLVVGFNNGLVCRASLQNGASRAAKCGNAAAEPHQTANALASAYGGGARVTWTPGDSQAFLLLEASSDGGSTWTQVAKTAANVGQAVIGNLAAGTEQTIRLTPVSFTGEKGPSSVVSVRIPPALSNIPTQVQDLRADAHLGQFRLTWQPALAATPLSGYDLQSKPSESTEWAETGTVNAESQSSPVPWPEGTPPGTTFDFRVRAKTETGAGEWSAVASAQVPTPPASPLWVSAASTEHGVRLHWQSGALQGVEKFRISYRLGGEGDWASVTVPDGSLSDYEVTGLVDGSSYDFQVFAVGAGGDSAASPPVTQSAGTVP